MAATKVQTSDTIRQAIAAGVTICGENRVQEMTAHLDDDAYAGAALHFIGHLQTNKVRQVVGRVELIESVGSEHLLEAIEAQAAKLELVQDILLEVNIGGGRRPRAAFPRRSCPPWPPRRLAAPCAPARGSWQSLPWPPGRTETARFCKMRQLYVDIRSQMDDNKTSFDCLSMGMSGDFEDAVREGATLVRVGTALFGPRPPMHKG